MEKNALENDRHVPRLLWILLEKRDTEHQQNGWCENHAEHKVLRDVGVSLTTVQQPRDELQQKRTKFAVMWIRNAPQLWHELKANVMKGKSLFDRELVSLNPIRNVVEDTVRIYVSKTKSVMPLPERVARALCS